MRRKLETIEMTALPFDIAAYLPASIQELVGVVGLPAALRIVELRGGIKLSVPKYVDRDHWLVAEIGLAAFEALAQHYGGNELEIARCLKALRAVEAVQFRADWSAGLSQAALAQKYGLTERGVRHRLDRILRDRNLPKTMQLSNTTKSPQLDLFDTAEP